MRKTMAIAAIALAAASGCPAWATEDGGVQTRFPARYFAQFHPVNALDMVRRLPGFSLDPGDPTRRGMAEASGNVVIDGKRVADKTFTLDEVLERIPAAQVDYVEVIRNGASGIDMLGQPVVANVVRRAAAGGSSAITLSNTVYADGRFAPGITIERTRTSGDGHSLSMSASVSRYVEVTKGDGTRIRTDTLGRRIEQADVDAAAGGTTGYAQVTGELPALGGQLRLNATATWTDYRDHQVDGAFYPVAVRTTLDEDLGGVGGGQAGLEAGAHLTRAFGGRLESETTISGRIGRKSYSSLLSGPGARTRFDERDRTGEALARTQLRFRPSTALMIAVDLEGAYNSLDTSSALAFNDFAIPLPNGAAHVTEIRRDAGAVATWQASPTLELQAGLHHEASRIDAAADTSLTSTYRFLKPNAHLNWTPAAGHQLRLRAERTVGQLDFTNFVAAASLDKGVVSAGNTRLRPNSAWLGEIGYEWRTASRFTILLAYRHSWLRDVVDRVPVLAPGASVASFDAPGNIGSGREDLIDLDATIPLVRILSASELKLSMAWRRDRVTDPTTRESRPISLLKPFTFTADFHQDLPRLKAAWGASLDAGWRTRTYLFNEIDLNRASTLLTLFADWNPNSRLSIHVEASDLFQREYRRTIEFHAGPRGVSGPLYRDDRRLALGGALTLRIRRTF